MKNTLVYAAVITGTIAAAFLIEEIRIRYRKHIRQRNYEEYKKSRTENG